MWKRIDESMVINGGNWVRWEKESKTVICVFKGTRKDERFKSKIADAIKVNRIEELEDKVNVYTGETIRFLCPFHLYRKLWSVKPNMIIRIEYKGDGENIVQDESYRMKKFEVDIYETDKEIIFKS